MATDTTQVGLYVAYGALMTMAIVPIYAGSFASLRGIKRPANAPKPKKSSSPLDDSDDEDTSETESISAGDAWMFPVIGSCVLFSLYLAFKFLDKDKLNMLLSGYFSLMGCAAVAKTGLMVARKVIPTCILKHVVKYKFRINKSPVAKANVSAKDAATKKEKRQKEKPVWHMNLTWVHFALFLGSLGLTAFYSWTKNWIASNVFGISFSINAIQLISLDSFKTGMILLSGLFIYDIFWVFGTEVMVSVAKNFDAPIKVIWPRDVIAYVLQTSEAAKNFTMLGLGDIVIPGIFVALCLRFDRHMAWKRNPTGEFRSTDFPKPYFAACSFAYFAGLCTTMGVMHIFKAAQPALLYLSPACILAPLITAAVRGELKDLFEYTAEEEKEDEKKSKSKQSKKKTKAATDDSEDSTSSEEETPKNK